jgi:hypothetical protein
MLQPFSANICSFDPPVSAASRGEIHNRLLLAIDRLKMRWVQKVLTIEVILIPSVL